MRQIIFLLFFVTLLYKPISGQLDDDGKEKCENPPSSECDENVLVSHMAEMEVTDPESIVALSMSNTNTDSLCRKLTEQLEKIHKYVGTCKITDKHNFFMSLIAGIRTLYRNVCKTPEFSRRFDLYYPCLHELRKDFDSCSGPTDWFEDKNEEELCKSYKFIVDCHYIKVAKVCGIDAAKALKQLIQDITNQIITVKCSNVAKDPVVNDPMPDSYLCAKVGYLQSSIEVVTLSTFLRIYLI